MRLLATFATVYARCLKWCRRTSAWIVLVLSIKAVIVGPPLVVELQRWLEPLVSRFTWLPQANAWYALAILWYAFLSQMKPIWFVLLPIYLFLFPFFHVAGIALKLLGVPAWGFIKSFSETTPKSPSDGAKKGRWYSRGRRAWVLLLLLWLAVLRGIESPWLACIPPVLMFPVWWHLLRVAYGFAVSPAALGTVLVTGCTHLLDSHIKANQESSDKSGHGRGATTTCNIVEWVLQRYPEDRIVSVLQRESLTIFAISLLVALAASSVFWGLVGTAAMSFSDDLRNGYDFFQSGSLAEATLWAWGCMTTTIDFPGKGSPLLLKLVHALIVATGLFQLTFLLACFSIMAGTEGTRFSASVKDAIQVIRGKIGELRLLESPPSVVVDSPQGEVANSPPGREIIVGEG